MIYILYFYYYLFISLSKVIFVLYLQIYRVSHKGWDCKDDIKLLKYENLRGSALNIGLLCKALWLFGFFKGFCKERKKFKVSGNHDYKETDSTNSVQSSLKFHPLWVPLYVHVCIYVPKNLIINYFYIIFV